MNTFIVSGISRGLGLAMAEAIIAAGNRLIGLSRHCPATLATLSAERFAFFTVDLSEPAGIDICMRQVFTLLAKHRSHGLYLINNAGTVAPIAPVGQCPPADILAALQLNLTAPMLLCNAFIGEARRHAEDIRILNISSGAAVKLTHGWSCYAASKAGLDHFSRHLALEQTGHARVCALYPGIIDTDMQARIRQTPSQDFPDQACFISLKDQGLLSTPADAAHRILAYLQHARFGEQAVVDIRNPDYPATENHEP